MEALLQHVLKLHWKKTGPGLPHLSLGFQVWGYCLRNKLGKVLYATLMDASRRLDDKVELPKQACWRVLTYDHKSLKPN